MFHNFDYKKDNLYLLVGKNIGKNLEEDMQNAKSSITIVSPYVSPSKIDSLIDLSKKGIKVDIYLSEDETIEYDDRSQSILRKIIKQNEHIDKEHYNNYKKDLEKFNLLKKKRQKRAKFIYLPFLALVIFFMYFLFSDTFAPFFKQSYKEVYNFIGSNFTILVFINGILGIALLKILFDIVYDAKDEPEYKPRYNYSYSYVNNNIKVYYTLKNKNDASILHAKYYVIDNKIVYTGSLNFTNNGFSNNLETCIKLEDEELAKQINDFTSNLFRSNLGFYYHSSLECTKWRRSLGHIIYNFNRY